MRMLDRKLVRDLWQQRGQVLAVALVVAAGIVGYCGSLSTYDSLRWLQASHYERSRFAHVFAQGKRAPLAEAARLADVAGVAEIETTLSFDVLLDQPGTLEPLTGRMIALPDHGLPRMNRLSLIHGSWIDAPESNQALVNVTFAKARNLKPGDRIDALLNGRRESFQVQGIVISPDYLFPTGGGVGDEEHFGVFWVGRKRLAAAFDMEGAFNTLAARLAPGASEPAAIAGLDRVLDRYGFTGAYGRADQMSHRILTQEIGQWRVYGAALPVVVLGVAVFLLNVALTRQISTQRAQIAALKALGRAEWEIARHYLKFVLVIVLLGAPLGVAGGIYFGHATTAIYAAYFRIPAFEYRMLPWIPLSAVAIALAAASAAVFGALVRVVRLPPAEAMRPPAPPSFAPTLLERIGLGRLYSPGARMVVRDMERRPLRALLTVLGIASAIAITITGTWWRDSLDYLLDVELRMRDRQDISVVLNAPVSTTALYDFQRLPGVLRAEGDRSAPVRLSNRQRAYRTSISAITADSQMHPLLDEQLRPAALPAGGIILNRRLADRLDLRLGDPVHVEVMQGAHAQTTLTVTALSHELTQLPAYMERAALNRLLGEGDALSGARLQIDAAQREPLLRQLKATPRVAAVAEVTAAIRHVRENAARNILFFSSVLTTLAVAIAFGVVYNNARVALAERAWDLASLRVLGFTRTEVSALLLGELGAQLLLALPIGCAMGAGLSWVILQLSTSDTMQLPFVIAPRTYAFASLAVLLAGVASALIVRRRIDRLDLVSVLKTRD